MKPSESLRLMGRPVAYFPQLAKPLGGVNASILFGHFFYWHDKTDNPLGVYRTAEEIEAETGLSVQEQRTARAKLRERGILLETQKRIEHRIYYRLDLDVFDGLMLAEQEKSAEKSSNIPEMQNQHSGNAESTFAECKINSPELQNQQPYIGTEDYYSNNNNNYNSAREISDFAAAAETAAEGWDVAPAGMPAAGLPAMPSENGKGAAATAEPLPDVSDGLPAEQPQPFPMSADWPPDDAAMGLNEQEAENGSNGELG